MFTLYSADIIGNPGNCTYPNQIEVTDEDSLRAAVRHDYVCAEYKNSYRNGDNFLSADCLPVDCDNDHSEDPADWVTPADVATAFPRYQLCGPLQPLQYAREKREACPAEVPYPFSN